MPEENRFFRFVWRVDAILLALAGLLVIVLACGVVTTEFFRPSYMPTPEGNFRPVPKGAEQDHTYRLEDQVSGTPLPHEKMLALREWKGAPESYGLHESMALMAYSSASRFTDAVNVLVIDTASTKTKWLFAGYARKILSQMTMFAGGPQSDTSPTQSAPIALVLRCVDVDTNKDGVLDSKDVQTLYYYRPGDERAVKFLSADYILSEEETGDGNFLVVYEKGTSAFAVTYHLPDFKLMSQRQLPEVPAH